MNEFTVGWDAGGAHLKAAAVDSSGLVVAASQRACPLWQGMDRLESAFAETLSTLPPQAAHAVTMTGELVDLFPNRRDGVNAIAQCCRRVLGDAVRFWAGDGFVGFDQVDGAWRKVASANWLATAALCARHLPDALMMDMGSTTTDLAAIENSTVRAQGLDDGDRMITGELVYSGVTRTPLMALGPRISFQGHTQGLAAEYFATAADVYRMLDKPIIDHYPTADGKGTSAEDCARRLARMVGRDWDDAPMETWRDLARTFFLRQMELIEHAAQRVLHAVPLPDDAPVVGAGQGAFNAETLANRLNRPYQSIGSLLRLPPACEPMAETVVAAIAVARVFIPVPGPRCAGPARRP